MFLDLVLSYQCLISNLGILLVRALIGERHFVATTRDYDLWTAEQGLRPISDEALCFLESNNANIIPTYMGQLI